MGVPCLSCRTLGGSTRAASGRFVVAKYFIVLGQEGRQLSRILRIGDSQWVPKPAPPIDLLIDGLQYRIDGK